jgi:arylsulfatase A-like enzyme/Flp pilus assembly protein TadD
MKKYHFCSRSVLILFFLGIIYALPSMRSLAKAEEKQNFLLITIDTLRADRLSCYGSRFPITPNIDRLRNRGVLFSRAFANTSTTLPSHANILLGTTPNHHGVHENLNFIVNEDLLTLAEHLKNNGYSTGAFVGAYPLDSRFGLSQGFDSYSDEYSRIHSVNLSSLERKAENVTEAAIEWLITRRSPWFLWIHCWDPHTPYDPPEPFKTQYKDHLYEGEVAYVDMVLGKLFEHMKDRNLSDSTLIVFTGDHGESLGQHGEETHGFFAYNSSLWIPLIISSPETTPGRVDSYISHVDIFPTVCDILGIPKPSFLQGTSLLPAMKGKKLPERPIYFESLYPYYSRGWAPLKGYVFEKKKFIDSPVPEIYDLNNDFDERNNLADREKISQFRSKLDNIIQALTPSERIEAARKVDDEARRKLASLGYVSSVRTTQKKDFGVQDDVKVLLPYFNKAGQGWKLYKEGQKEAGIKLLKEILEERKDIDMAYKNLASIYQETGDTQEAIIVLEQGLDSLPSNYELFAEYLKALVAAEQYDKTIVSFEKINLREVEYDPEIWNNLGTAYAKTGSFEKAIGAFEMGLSLDHKHPELYNNLANACYSYGLQSKNPNMYSMCFEYYKKAIELDPGYPAPYYGLGHAYRQEGNLDGAIYCWEKALEADPDFSQAHSDLALAYFYAGNKPKALDLLSDYKTRYYHLMAPEEKEKLDALIEQCQK